jgi:hypothetical protein
MISGWLKKPIIFLGLSMVISYGVMDMAIAQSPGRQRTSNIRINDVSIRVQTRGITQLRISSSTTSQNGVGMTCVQLSFDGTAGEFCEDINSGASSYVCEVSSNGTTVSGNCTCTGVCAGFANGCTDLGGEIVGGRCEFP